MTTSRTARQYESIVNLVKQEITVTCRVKGVRFNFFLCICMELLCQVLLGKDTKLRHLTAASESITKLSLR